MPKYESLQAMLAERNRLRDLYSKLCAADSKAQAVARETAGALEDFEDSEDYHELTDLENNPTIAPSLLLADAARIFQHMIEEGDVGSWDDVKDWLKVYNKEVDA